MNPCPRNRLFAHTCLFVRPHDSAPRFPSPGPSSPCRRCRASLARSRASEHAARPDPTQTTAKLLHPLPKNRDTRELGWNSVYSASGHRMAIPRMRELFGGAHQTTNSGHLSGCRTRARIKCQCLVSISRVSSCFKKCRAACSVVF